MAVNDDVLDSVNRRAVELELLKNGEWRKIRRLLRRLERDLVERLEEYGLGRSVKAERTERQIRAIRKIIANGADAFYNALENDMTLLAANELQWAEGSLARAVPVAVEWAVPTAGAIRTAVIEAPFGMGPREGAATLNDYVKTWRDRLDDRVTGTIRLGIIEGATTEDIVRRLRGTRGNDYTDGVLEVSRRSAQTLTRTVTNHVATATREEFYGRNQDIISGVQWVSTLDSRTSIICAERDGKVYKIGKGPRPPAHPNCRSTTVPIVKSAEEIGAAGYSIPPAKRASLNGEVPAEVDYETFLRRQDAGFQDKVLGATRAEAFRGGMKLDKFVNDAGRVLTIEELGL